MIFVKIKVLKKSLTIRRPKYHPETGVELFGDYDIDFYLPSERLIVQNLEQDILTLKSQITQLKNSNHTLKNKVKTLEKQLSSEIKEKEFYKEKYERPKLVRKLDRQRMAILRINRFDAERNSKTQVLKDLSLLSIDISKL